MFREIISALILIHILTAFAHLIPLRTFILGKKTKKIFNDIFRGQLLSFYLSMIVAVPIARIIQIWLYRFVFKPMQLDGTSLDLAVLFSLLIVLFVMQMLGERRILIDRLILDSPKNYKNLLLKSQLLQYSFWVLVTVPFVTWYPAKRFLLRTTINAFRWYYFKN